MFLRHSDIGAGRCPGREALLIVLLCAAAFFVNNSFLPSDLMECRNLVTAREMVGEGRWLLPTMNGELRLEKPLLPTWTAALVEAVRPHDMGAQRAVAGLMALLWTFFVYAIALHTTGKRSVAWMVAAVVLLSLMPEKKMRYLLPVMVPCAFAVAHLVDYYETDRQASPAKSPETFLGVSPARRSLRKHFWASFQPGGQGFGSGLVGVPHQRLCHCPDCPGSAYIARAPMRTCLLMVNDGSADDSLALMEDAERRKVPCHSSCQFPDKPQP